MSKNTTSTAEHIRIPRGDSWEQIAADYDKICATPYKPGESFPNPRTGTIIDEEKSVRWNREEVQRMQDAYKEEVRRLNIILKEAMASIDDRAVALIAYQADLSKEKAAILWDFVSRMHPTYGEMFEMIDEYIELARRLKE